MSRKAAFPILYSATWYPATSDALAWVHQAHAECLRARMLAGCQKRFARYGAGAAALAGYASVLALPNATHVSLWAMAAVFVAAVTSSLGARERSFDFSGIEYLPAHAARLFPRQSENL
jgi:hypothetical protein